MSTGFSLPSFAKINWSLRILGRRVDGFHELVTLFQSVSLSDTLHFAPADSLELTCDDPDVPLGDDNLIIKAGRALSDYVDVDRGAQIHLEKRIPSPGGLGGGSSNAAVALVGLSRLWNLNLDTSELQKIAVKCGSDVPFFLYGGTALGGGRGEMVEQVSDISEEYLLIVTPGISVSTSAAFERLNAPTLTNSDSNHILHVCRREAESTDPRRSVLINDFEQSVFRGFPEIERVKRALLDLGSVNAAMSGSGASVFAIFDKQETRQAAIKALDVESTWRKFAVATVSRSEYREALMV